MFVVLTFLSAQLFLFAQESVLIKGGTIYDGSTNEPYKADIFIIGDKIVYIGDCSDKKADKVINATGYIVTPGFIDPHSHTDNAMMKPETNSNECFLLQGITTTLTGMCGTSQFPIGKAMETMTRQGIGVNSGFFVGQGTLRRRVLGADQDRDATPEEIEKMKEMLSEGMNEGAFGMSTGLTYLPGSLTPTEEIVELAKAMSEKGGIYTTHVRGEARLSSIEEAILIGKEANVQVNISHIKCAIGSWGTADQTIELIEQAQKDGLYITADQYPYTASNTGLSALVPRWASIDGRPKLLERFDDPHVRPRLKAEMEEILERRGGADSVIVHNSHDAAYNGLTLEEIAKKMKLDPIDAAIELLKNGTPTAIYFLMREDDVVTFMAKPWVMTCTDGSFGSHPRATGSYSTKISKYVNDRNILTLNEMIHGSTGMVAKTYGIESRGFIREGYYADILVFNPSQFKAHSSYAKPKEFSTGLKLVLVNGKVAVENSKYTGVLAGVPIKKKNSVKYEEIFISQMNRFMEQNGIVGLAVAVVKDNKPVWRHDFGRRDIENKTQWTGNDIFRIASISKSFCSTSIMQLVEAGKVSLSDEAGEILGFPIINPKYPNVKITVEMLLSHTSSLNDSQGYKTLDPVHPDKNPNYAKCYSNYSPGYGYKYCNLNYNLLGAVVEKISGVRYDKYVKANIIDPLGLNASLNVADIDLSLCVPIYSFNAKTGEFEPNPQAYYPLAKSDDEYILGYDPALFSTTGGMKIGAADLAKYMMMHMNYGEIDGVRIISETSSKYMQSRITTTDVDNAWYGLALRSMDHSWVPEAVLKGHTGSAWGVTTTMTYNPVEKYGFVTLCNAYSCPRPSVNFDRMLYYYFIY